MTSRDFVYWLQGFFEMSDAKTLTAPETAIVKKHLALVFKHEIDPSMGGPKHQAKLNKAHGLNIGGTSPDGTIKYRC